MKTALVLLGLATLGACRKRDTPPAPEPGEPGQGYEGDPGPRGGEILPRVVQPPPADVPTQPPEIVLGPCRLVSAAGGDDAPYVAAIPGELLGGMGSLLACYQPPRAVGHAEIALVIAAGGKLGKPSIKGVPPALADCWARALPQSQLSAPPTPDLGVTCELATLPEHGLAHQALEAAPLLRLTDALRRDGQPVSTPLPPGRVLLEPDPDTPTRAVMAALASPALAGHEVGFVIARAGRRYQLAAVHGRPVPDGGALIWVAPDSLWVGTGEDRRQIRNQEPGAYDFAALTATLGKLRTSAPLWFRLDAAIAADDRVSYDTLTRIIEAALAAGFVDFRVVPRAALPATFAR